jgi:DNA topoisomerase I
MTQLERLQKIGIARRGSQKRGFRYRTATGAKVSASDLTRINNLRIPPAWTEVAINPSTTGAIQVIGQDAAGRWQYLYHDNHVKRQEAKKFQRLLKFAGALPSMRKIVARELRRTDLGRERVMAAILRILSTCFIRPGSQAYADDNGSYGVATLRPGHLRVRGDVIEFNFRGKSGIQQHAELKDRQVAKVVRALLREPAREVFKYQNGDGHFVDVKRRHINDYIREVMGASFSAKDFRTWAGTLVCACALARQDSEVPKTRAAQKRKIVAAIKETASVLGNTPAVCRSSYICPAVLKNFERGKVIARHFETIEKLVNYRAAHLHEAERALVRMLSQKT